MEEPHGARRNSSDSSAGLLLGLASAAVLAILAYVAFAKQGIGIDLEWAWQTIKEPRYRALGLPLVASGILFLLLASLLIRMPIRTRRREVGVVAGAALALFLFQTALTSLGRAGHIDTLFASYPPANAYFDRATDIESVPGYLAGYRREIREQRFRVQLSTHPPGSVLFYVPFIRLSERFPRAAGALCSLVRRIPSVKEAREVPEIRIALGRRIRRPEHEAAAWLAAIVLRFLASLVVVPLYLLCRLELSPRDALPAALMGATVPALFLFSPHPDQLFPLLACTFFWLVGLGLRRLNWCAALGAGFLLFLGLFFSLSFAAVAFVGLVVWAIAIWRNPCRAHLRLALAGLAGLAVPALLLMLTFGHDLLGVWRACAERNDEFNSHSGRTYWKWLIYNPLELAIFAGAPAFILFWRLWLADLNRRWLYGELRPGRQTPPESGDAGPDAQGNGRVTLGALPFLSDLVIAVGLTLVLLNLSGKNLGEVGRLWMIVMPVMGVAAGKTWEKWGQTDVGFLLALVALQLAQIVGLRLFLDVMGMITIS